MSERSLHQDLVSELKVIRKHGLHRMSDHLEELQALAELARRVTGSPTAEGVERLLRDVYTTRAEGAQGTAVGILLGLEVGRRGARPAVLREVAAKRLGYSSVDTFRKKPEANAISYFADLVESYCIDYRPHPDNDEYRINKAMAAIMELNMEEYYELIKRLNERFARLHTS